MTEPMNEPVNEPVNEPETELPDFAEAPRVFTPAAQRALAEAAARKAAIDAREAELKKVAELAGRGGLDPVRYDDWEIKGIAADF